MSSALDDAWELALSAPRRELGPWRVLADMLLGEGAPRGEWMQLELDAEQAPLKGLARGRLVRLREELLPQLLPLGVVPTKVEVHRGVLVGCVVIASQARTPNDVRWQTVRRLAFSPERQPPSIQSWQRTPLGGPHLRRLVSLVDIEQEAMEVLASGPAIPSLESLGLLGHVGRPPGGGPAPWARWWSLVLPRHPKLREVHLGWSGLQSVTEARLEGVRTAALTRVLVSAGPDDLRGLHTWAVAARPDWEFVAEFRDPRLAGASVVLGQSVLVLRCSPAQAERAEEQIRSSWRGRVDVPELRHEPLAAP